MCILHHLHKILLWIQTYVVGVLGFCLFVFGFLFFLTIEMDKEICIFLYGWGTNCCFHDKNVILYTWNFGLWNLRLGVVKYNVYFMVYLFPWLLCFWMQHRWGSSAIISLSLPKLNFSYYGYQLPMCSISFSAALSGTWAQFKLQFSFPKTFPVGMLALGYVNMKQLWNALLDFIAYQ